MSLSTGQIIQLIQFFGFPTAVAVMIAYGFVAEKVVPGAYANRLRNERDEALALLKSKGDENERDLRDLRSRIEGGVSPRGRA
jgi:hypothetical protein